MKIFFFTLGIVFCITQGYAQNSNQQKLSEDFNAFRKALKADFDSFRKQSMEDFADFVSNPWKEFEGKESEPVPKEKTIPPVVMPEEDKDKHGDNKPIIIKEIVSPKPVRPVPQPQPVEPVEEVPVIDAHYMEFTFFGTTGKVRFDPKDIIHLNDVTEKSISDALRKIEPEEYDNLLIDCLKLREQHHLSDWAYLLMLNTLAETICGKSSNDATLLLAYLYMQSGYKMRLASSGDKLYMLYASKHYIYDKEMYEIDGYNYYCLSSLPKRMHICEAAFPKEQALSLVINQTQQFEENMDKERTVRSKRYPDVTVSFSVNKNILSFYHTYPTSMIDDNMMTRWAMYANTPLDTKLKNQIYPQLQLHIEGKSQIEAANILLNWVQTGFEYEYDSKIWGEDRAFFAEESLYYPYCDCEDRSILFTRLIRDLLGLKCILIYYPGHLACAVNFTEEVNGDHILINGKRYVVTDPTYINASVGNTMPDMDNNSAKVILLE